MSHDNASSKRGWLSMLDPPEALEARRIDAGEEEFAILEWPASLPPLPASLTDAERDIVGSMLSGATNAEIAHTRGRSVRTVANQIASAFKKLAVRSRLELFARFGVAGDEAAAAAGQGRNGVGRTFSE